MIVHAVFLSLSSEANLGELAEIMRGLEGLVGKIDGFTGFHHGPNRDYEGKSPEAAYGFFCTFQNRKALERYSVDARHAALGSQLVGLCGGAEAIKVYDIETVESP